MAFQMGTNSREAAIPGEVLGKLFYQLTVLLNVINQPKTSLSILSTKFQLEKTVILCEYRATIQAVKE